MTANYEMKRKYMMPSIRLKEILTEPFLGDSTETLDYDINDGTDEALSKEGSIWDDYEKSVPQSIFDE